MAMEFEMVLKHSGNDHVHVVVRSRDWNPRTSSTSSSSELAIGEASQWILSAALLVSPGDLARSHCSYKKEGFVEFLKLNVEFFSRLDCFF